MSSIEKRMRNGRTPWYARWRDDQGAQRVKVFDRKIDAEKYLTVIGASLLTDSYVDPRSGAITVDQFFEQWAVDPHDGEVRHD